MTFDCKDVLHQLRQRIRSSHPTASRLAIDGPFGNCFV